jgi:hypothetical protein
VTEAGSGHDEAPDAVAEVDGAGFWKEAQDAQRLVDLEVDAFTSGGVDVEQVALRTL